MGEMGKILMMSTLVDLIQAILTKGKTILERTPKWRPVKS